MNTRRAWSTYLVDGSTRAGKSHERVRLLNRDDGSRRVLWIVIQQDEEIILCTEHLVITDPPQANIMT